MTSSATEKLANLLERPVDRATRARVSLHLVDWAACAALGATAPAGTALAAYGRRSATGRCQTMNAGKRSAEVAAFVNGGLGNIFEMDDLHRTSIVHPGDVVIPAALAVAERDHANGSDFLDGIARGYEAAIRIGSAAGTGHYEHWYKSATCGVFGAAAAAASVLDLDHSATVDALGHAGMQAAGLWQCRMEPTFGKQLATARAAQSGVIAADLAATRFTGVREILEGPHGFIAATCPDGDVSIVAGQPDADWRLHEVSFKPWSACRHTHPVIEAGFILRQRNGSARPRKINIETYQAAVDFCDDSEPGTPHEARFSLQHCVALALLVGRADLDEFSESAISKESISQLRRRVSVRGNAAMTREFPQRYAAAVEVAYEDGNSDSVSVMTAKGDPENPMTEAEIRDKARQLLTATGATEQLIEDLWQAAYTLTDGGNVATFTKALGHIVPLASVQQYEGETLHEAR